MELTMRQIMQLTELESQMLFALRKSAEDSVSNEWSPVYIDNARVDGVSDRQKAALLSNLQQKGFYRHYDDENRGVWGDVKLTD